MRLERVLTCDPGMGIIRHVDAGYEKGEGSGEEEEHEGADGVKD